MTRPASHFTIRASLTSSARSLRSGSLPWPGKASVIRIDFVKVRSQHSAIKLCLRSSRAVKQKRPPHSLGAPSGTPFPSVRTGLSEPCGADCIPGGVSPCGLEAGAPPDLVSSGPVFPWGCVTLLLECVFVVDSLEFGWENAGDAANKTKAAAMSTRSMGHLPKASPETGSSSNGFGAATGSTSFDGALLTW